MPVKKTHTSARTRMMIALSVRSMYARAFAGCEPLSLEIKIAKRDTDHPIHRPAAPPARRSLVS